MKPSPWPDAWMGHIKAKSAKYGGETLAEHTWDVLAKLAELRQLRPELPSIIGVPRLWHCLFWTCLLHDFGKAARGFQERLAGGPRWDHRHEVLSLAFLDWIAAGLDDDEQTWVLAAIVSHHRDAEYIARAYAAGAEDPLVPLLAEVDEATVAHLWRWVAACATAWRDALGFTSAEVAEITPMEQAAAMSLVCKGGVRRVRAALDRYADWLDELPYESVTTVRLGILLRGLTTSADHMASAHLQHMPAPVQEPWTQLAMRIRKQPSPAEAYADAYKHQRTAGATVGSALLIAPTGSGKTETALYWALGDGSAPVPRLFYALPYQASMNAMFDRLRDDTKGFGDKAVGLQHGRAVQAMHARLLDNETGAVTAAGAARWEKNINTLHARPIKVFSPYQMLKAMFQLRGFEAMLTDYVQAAFIFDEIHAYDPERLALIVALVRYIREHFGARFFVMSATFPSMIRAKLVDALGEYATITADAEVFATFRRHRLWLLDGEVTAPSSIQRIAGDVRAGKQVLVCINTVARAQQVREALRHEGLRDDDLLLIHSRYIFRDRNQLEKDITAFCGVDVPLTRRKPLALIATQVVEVSLNIDLDTIYSDPAPLEALLQRFGRVNRQCKKGICPVYVFRQPTDGQGVYGRGQGKNDETAGHNVRVTLAELEKHTGAEIDEEAINGWLDTIYADPQFAAQWESSYQRIAQQARGILASLRPFTSDEQKEEQFEQLFDSVEVVPVCFEQQYIGHLIKDEFIEASTYGVGISKQKFAILKRKGLVLRAEAEGQRGAWLARLSYDKKQGLSFEEDMRDPDWS